MPCEPCEHKVVMRLDAKPAEREHEEQEADDDDDDL